MQSEGCWCGESASFALCCEPYLLGVTQPPTAVELMRSRYSAYVTQDGDYLLATWHPDTRPASIDFDERLRWLGLKVVQTEAGGVSDTAGTVKFVARYRIAGRGYRLEELSRFARVDGRWFYAEAVVMPQAI